MFEEIKAHVTDPAHREMYVQAVAFLDREYSERAIRAREDTAEASLPNPRPAPPEGFVPVAPDPPNATYRRLGTFISDALKWVLPDMADSERAERASALLYVAWITSDPSTHERGVGLSELEKTPWEDPTMTVPGRRWSKMRALETIEGWRERWMNLVRIAWTITQRAPRPSTLSATVTAAAPAATGAPSTSPDVAQNIFQRTDDVWKIEFAGVSALVNHSIGMDHIKRLIQHPRRALSAVEIEGGVGTLTKADKQVSPEGIRKLKEAKTRIEGEILAATVSAVRDSKEADLKEINAELLAAVGVHGRGRTLGDDDRKAQLRVGRNIKTALRAIGRHHVLAAAHLRGAIKDPSGASPRYDPDPMVNWFVE